MVRRAAAPLSPVVIIVDVHGVVVESSAACRASAAAIYYVYCARGARLPLLEYLDMPGAEGRHRLARAARARARCVGGMHTIMIKKSRYILQ